MVGVRKDGARVIHYNTYKYVVLVFFSRTLYDVQCTLYDVHLYTPYIVVLDNMTKFI